MNVRLERSTRRATRVARFAAVAAVALPFAACDALLDVDDIDVALPDDFTNEAALPSIRAAAIGDFAYAFSGAASNSNNGQVLASGALSDEFYSSDTFPTRRQVDRRAVLPNNATSQTDFRNLHRARATAERAISAFAEFGPGEPGYTEVLSLGGYSYIVFGENYCSGVPFSEQQPDGELVYGDPLSTAEMFEEAVDRFDRALAASQDERTTNLALVGKARALLDLDRPAEAADAIASVPTSFVYEVEHSSNTTREVNGIFNMNNLLGRYTVANREGENGLPFAEDPRVPVVEEGSPFDTRFPFTFYSQLKYADRDANVVLASGIEARLIEAEAALRAGDLDAVITMLNDLRASAELDPLDAAGATAATVRDLLFEERAYWMYGTSHRLGDLRRLIRQYGLAADDVFPTGEYFSGEPYGDDVSLPVPVDELNNPNFESCDTTIA